jgi:transcriptional regulator
MTAASERQKLRDQVLRLRKRGLKQHEIAKLVGVVRTTVARIEIAAGVRRTKPHGPIERVTVELRAKVLELAGQGLTQDEIAERLGMVQQTVSRIEHAAGLRRRRRRSFSDAATGLHKKRRKSSGGVPAFGGPASMDYRETLDELYAPEPLTLRKPSGKATE